MQKELLDQLETPCIVIDMARAEENVIRMQAEADAAGCRLRPHIKTHKMPLFTRMQMAHGAAGITCAKVSEAEVMADGGAEDIFIAYPMVGDFRIKITLEVRLEVDTGAKRTGVQRTKAAELAKEVHQLSNLNLTGIYTFKSLVYHDEPTEDKVIAGAEEGDMMEAIAEEIRKAGVPIAEISAGSTPTGVEVAKTGKVDEIRPGTYIFKDYMLCKEGAAEPEDIAVRIYATVVSTPCREYAVIDGGTKTFPMDILLDTPPYYYPGYALIAGNDDLQLRRMNEEHGIITSKKGDTGLKVGDKVELIPIHVCTAINMQNKVYLYDGETLRQEVVAARGMLV